MKHIVASRYLKDGMIQQDIASLLYLVKDTAATVAPSDDDISLNKQSLNLQKDGIWVTVRKNWNDTDENWILTGFGINDDKGQMTKEAQDTIKVVSTQYGYTPEHLSISEQVGACMTSINNIVNQISDDVKRKLYPNFTPQQISQEALQQKYDDLHAKVHEHCTVTIDGKTTELKQGLLNGYCDAREELDKWQNMTPKDLRNLANDMEKSNNKNIAR